MSPVLIVAGNLAMLHLLVGTLGRLGQPRVDCARRAAATVLIGPDHQVLVYASERGADPPWVAAVLEAHPALCAVHLSPTPRVSPPCARARCMFLTLACCAGWWRSC